MANPTLLTSPIAENGDKNVIPATTGATTGLLDQEHGFQQINELPLQAGGLPPQRKDFNGVFNLLSGILYMAQRGYTFEYDNTLPYVVGCIVIDPLDGKTYRCINDVPAGGSNPSADTTNWMPYDCLPLNGGGALTGTSLTWNGNDLGGSSIVAKSFGSYTGYVKYASGLIVEWGLAICTAGTVVDVTLPITYTNSCIIVTGNLVDDNVNYPIAQAWPTISEPNSKISIRSNHNNHVGWITLGF
jgi:hypothetical protein